MKLFIVKWQEPNGPACEWHPNEGAARQRSAQLANVSSENTVEPFELPTTKLEMCVFLNKHRVGTVTQW